MTQATLQPPAFVTPEYIERLKKIAERIKDYWVLCEFAGKTEAEVIVWQSINAAILNLDRIGIPCSFKDLEPYGAENDEGYDIVKERQWIRDQTAHRTESPPPDDVKPNGRGFVTVIWVTPKLFDDIEKHLGRAA